MAQHTDIDPSALGQNMWLIDEMYRRFREDPDSVGEAWKEFFEDFTPALGGDGGAPTEELRAASPHPTPPSAPPPAASTVAPAPDSAPSQTSAPPTPAPPKADQVQPVASKIPEGAERLRFGAERIARNMERSRELPTATSFRFVPAKLLEENRRVINRFLTAGRGG